MRNLPKRKPTITATLDEDEDVSCTMKTLTSRESADLMQASTDVQDIEDPETGKAKVNVSFPMGELVSLWDRKVESLSVEIEGEAFDPSNKEHLNSVPVNWKLEFATALVNDSLVSQAELKN